ncbi:MAG: hypothetical protein JWR26_3407 [Pedosphaera sp.]|nr:hypothetical protein [Pedosphaera sp.]
MRLLAVPPTSLFTPQTPSSHSLSDYRTLLRWQGRLQNTGPVRHQPRAFLTMTDKINRQNFFPLALMGAIVFFGLLWLLDFPKPGYDDLFSTGAALNLAEGGDFSSPLIARQEFPGHFYYVHPPLYSYTLAGWLKVLGISAAAATGFQMLMFIIIAAATIAILRRYQAPVWLEWLVPLGVSITLLPMGLRYDAFSIALTMAGFALIECGFTGGLSVFVAFLLMFLGASVTPRLTLFSAALILLAGYHLWRDSSAVGWRRWTFCGLGVGALLLTWFVLLWMIGFHVGDYYATYHYHVTNLVSIGKLKLMAPFFLSQRYTAWPVWAVFLGVLFLSLRRPKDRLTQIGFLMALTFPAVAAIGGLSPDCVWYMILALFVMAGSLLKTISRCQSIFLGTALCVTLLMASFKTGLNMLGIVTGQIKADMGELRAQALALRPTPEHPLLIDTTVARYLYDYRIPAGCIDIGFAAPFPDEFVTTADLRLDDIYVTGTGIMLGLERDTYLPPTPVEYWNPVHFSLWSFNRYPRKIVIIHPEECKGLRLDSPIVAGRRHHK